LEKKSNDPPALKPLFTVIPAFLKTREQGLLKPVFVPEEK